MRVLVTGASGFVGMYLVEALRAAGHTVCAAGGPRESDGLLPIDLGDIETLHAALDVAQPETIFHLAAQSFVPDALASPLDTYDTNTLGTARLLQAVRERRDRGGGNPRVLFTSSAQVYGAHDPHAYPLRESAGLRPSDPYTASKAAAESIVIGEVLSYEIDAVIARAFNHIGPGQSDRFVVSSFAAQLAHIADGAPPVMHVGNLSAQRDFLDVRDVVEAYIALAQSGEAGEVYNVCSGMAVRIEEILRELILIAHVPVEIREDPQRLRPSDVPFFYGSNAKLRDRTGWEPRIALRRSLREIYDAARKSAA